MDFWFIDEENIGSALLNELELGGFQHNQYLVFSHKKCVKTWVSQYPLHARLFDAYQAGKNQADFYMVSVLTQILQTEREIKKHIVLMTKDKELVQAFAGCCQRFEVSLDLLVSQEEGHLPLPEVAKELNVRPRMFKHPKRNDLSPSSTRQNKKTRNSQEVPNTHPPQTNGKTEKSPKPTIIISDDKRSKTQKKICKLLKKSPKSVQQLMELLNLSLRDINDIIAPMIKNGAIERVSKNGKKWQLAY